MLSWATTSLIADGRGLSDIVQGVTLEVMGEGNSMGPLNEEMRQRMRERQTDIQYDVAWTTLDGYLRWLVERGVSPNVASFVGATTARVYVVGYEDRAPTPEKLEQVRSLFVRRWRRARWGLIRAHLHAGLLRRRSPVIRIQLGVDLDTNGNPLPNGFAPFPVAADREAALELAHVQAAPSHTAFEIRDLEPLVSARPYEVWLWNAETGNSAPATADYYTIETVIVTDELGQQTEHPLLPGDCGVERTPRFHSHQLNARGRDAWRVHACGTDESRDFRSARGPGPVGPVPGSGWYAGRSVGRHLYPPQRLEVRRPGFRGSRRFPYVPRVRSR
jgi:hypothetical protein